MAESAPNMTERNSDLFDKGYGRGAAKAREEIAAKLGLKTPAEIDAYVERLRKQEADRLAAEGKTSELLTMREREIEDFKAQLQRAEEDLRASRFDSQFRAEAHRAGVDADLAILLVRPEERVLDDQGRAVGVGQIVARIVKEKPILKGGATGPVGSVLGIGGGDASEKGKKLADLRAQYVELKKDPRTANEALIRLSRQIQEIEHASA